MCVRECHKDGQRVCYQEVAKWNRGNSVGLRRADFSRGDADSLLRSGIHMSAYLQCCHKKTVRVSHIHSLFPCQSTLQMEKSDRVHVRGSSLAQIGEAYELFLLIDRLDAA